MKYLIILLSLFFVACSQGESFYAKDCIYNSWADGKAHCGKYNVVRVDDKTLRHNQRQYYSRYYYQPRPYYYPVRYF